MMTGERESERVVLRGLCLAYLHGNDMRHTRARTTTGHRDDTKRTKREEV